METHLDKNQVSLSHSAIELEIILLHKTKNIAEWFVFLGAICEYLAGLVTDDGNV